MIAVKVARLSCGLAASTIACVLTLALPARAQDLSPTLLVYKAPPECPLVGDFQRSVERRSSRIHFVDEGSHDRELSIFLHKDGEYTVGELRLIERNGSLRQRSVRFGTCAEAVEGLALIATVSLDPQALLEEPKPVPETGPAAPKATPQPTPATPRTPERTKAPPAKPPQEEGFAQTSIGGEGNVLINVFPKPAFGGSAFVDVASSSRHLFSPSIRGAITFVERLGVDLSSADLPAGTKADAKLALFSLLGCPLRIGGNVLIFRPCVALAGGTVYTRGIGLGSSTASYRPQFSWGASGVFSVRLTSDVA
ncbi:MAG TPA: hypothetical protein VGM44_22430, partial [Polyangiaceae bacterium]